MNELARAVAAIKTEGARLGLIFSEESAMRIARAAMAVMKDPEPFEDALFDLCMLRAQQEVGCVPAPSKDAWRKAWQTAEDLVRREG